MYDPRLLWAFCAVELRDREGDLFRVSGFRGQIQKNGGVPLVGTTHRYSPLPNGTQPNFATVREFVRTTKTVKGREYPALVFGAEYRDDPDPFVVHYKSQYNNRHMNAFSVGFEAYEKRALPGGRYEYLDWDLFEISACLTPRDPQLTVISVPADSTHSPAADRLAPLRKAILQLDRKLIAIRG